MIPIKRQIVVSPERRKKKGVLITKNVPIFFRLTYLRKRINLYTGFRIDLDCWDEKRERVKNNCSNANFQSAEYINTVINKYLSELNTSFLEFEVKETPPTSEEIKEIFDRIKNRDKNDKPIRKEKSFDILEAIEDFKSTMGKLNNWTPKTYEKYDSLKARLKEFKPDISFDDMNEEGLIELMIFFSNEVKLKNTTTAKHFGFLKTFLRYAVKKGYTNITDFKDFKPKFKKTKNQIIFFNEEELEMIKKAEIPEEKKYLMRVRDVLLFLCYTGLRYSDVYKLKRSDIRDNTLYVTTKKTNDSLTIELNNTSKAILDKYKDIPYKDDKAFPVISNQKFNVYLRDLAIIAKINEPITEVYFKGNKRFEKTEPKHKFVSSHIGRRTFICLCIAKGIPIQVIMEWTGHSDYKSMKPYIAVADTTKETQMQKLNL